MKFKVSIYISFLSIVVLQLPLFSEPLHDCSFVCELACQDAIEQNHYEDPNNVKCSNGALGYGSVAGGCVTDWDITPSYVQQSCGNGYNGPGTSGCLGSGRLKCPISGQIKYPSFSLDCPTKFIGGRWELPVMQLGQGAGACAYSDSTGKGVQCSLLGGVQYLTFP